MREGVFMYRNVRVIPRRLLYELYVEKKWSLRDLAEYFQCSVDTIERRMKAYQIPRRPLKKEINMRHVQSLYETGRWSLCALAKLYGVSVTTMANRMREHGLLCSTSHSPVSMDVVKICKAYESGNSTDYIARIYGLSRWKVLHVLRHMGLSVRRNRHKSDRVDEMAYLYTHHCMSTDDIALAYGVKGATVAVYLREYGITLRSNRLDLDENRIRTLRGEGLGVRRIAQMMGCSASAVRKRLERNYSTYNH
ncbi:helix-turn-helix domain-containing protein [Veillonella denticariosi]|nr:helix-turn-helix domain-containing protein [Veillonella denticariosi]